MVNHDYTVEVEGYLLGQFRIHLLKKGLIVRDMCTYKTEKLSEAIVSLAASEDPEALVESWATPHNCESLGGRIRLDTTEADNPYRQHEHPWEKPQ